MKSFDNKEFEKKAVVSYILDGDNVLLIEKKRGLGAGKINVPGGHIEENESPYDAAIRETYEEVSLHTKELILMGYLYFKFTDGLTMKGWVYTTEHFSGIPQESPEANPFWMNKQSLPFEKMWADDMIWIPQMFKGRYFRGYFEFDGDLLIKRKIQFYDSKDEFIS